MPKWRIIIPILIVIVLVAVVYLQGSPSAEPEESAPPVTEEELVDIAERPLGVTGSEDVVEQVDVLLEEMLDELDDEQTLAGDGTADINAEIGSESDGDILDVEYYEE